MIPGTEEYRQWEAERDAKEDACYRSMQFVNSGNPKDIAAQRRPGIHDIPLSTLFHVGRVMQLGREKYGPCNWRGDAVRASVYLDAMFRHLAKYWDGEELDDESKEAHLAHVAACCLIVLDARNCGKLIDDRPPRGPAVQVIRDLTEAAS